jgi:integrase/recombinase XerD
MKTRVNIIFWFRKKRQQAEEEKTAVTPGGIVCRITVAGKDCEFATGHFTTYGEWDSTSGRVRGRGDAARLINESLVKTRDQLTDIAADLERQKKSVTARRLMSIYKADGCDLSMLGLFDTFLAEQRTLIGVEISKSTLVQHQSRYSNITAFLTAQKLTDLRPEEFTHNMADKMLYWLMGSKGHKRNTALKNLQNVSQVLSWGVRRELLDKNPMDRYQYKLAEPKEIHYLTEVELEVLTENAMPVEALEKVRDCFVFQCWTGLAYADIKGLDVAKVLEIDANGGKLLRVRRQKSTIHKGYICVIPILPEAERLLNKYQGVLPVPSNQVYNRYLKQVGELCGIESEKMTTHVGRKTAGVLMLNRGIRMEVVSKFLGHSSVKMTEKAYAKILDNTLVNEFSRVFGTPTAAPSTAVRQIEAVEWRSPEPPEPREERRPARRFLIVDAALAMKGDAVA